MIDCELKQFFFAYKKRSVRTVQNTFACKLVVKPQETPATK